MMYEGKLLDFDPQLKDDSYLFELCQDGCKYWIDASVDDGTLGRLINDQHIRPNCSAKLIKPEMGGPQIGLFALTDINVGDELRYSYGGKNATYPWRVKVGRPSTSPQTITKRKHMVDMEDIATRGREREKACAVKRSRLTVTPHLQERTPLNKACRPSTSQQLSTERRRMVDMEDIDTRGREWEKAYAVQRSRLTVASHLHEKTPLNKAARSFTSQQLSTERQHMADIEDRATRGWELEKHSAAKRSRQTVTPHLHKRTPLCKPLRDSSQSSDDNYTSDRDCQLATTEDRATRGRELEKQSAAKRSRRTVTPHLQKRTLLCKPLSDSSQSSDDNYTSDRDCQLSAAESEHDQLAKQPAAQLQRRNYHLDPQRAERVAISSTPRQKKRCPLCKINVIDINRHLRGMHQLSHGEAINISSPLRKGVKQDMHKCPVDGCNKWLTRIDKHLSRGHKFVGAVYYRHLNKYLENKLSDADAANDMPPVVVRNHETILTKFEAWLESAASGQRSRRSARQYSAQVLYMWELTTDSHSISSFINYMKFEERFVNPTLERNVLQLGMVMSYLTGMNQFICFLKSVGRFPRRLGVRFLSNLKGLMKTISKQVCFRRAECSARDLQRRVTSELITRIEGTNSYKSARHALNSLERNMFVPIGASLYIAITCYIWLELLLSSGHSSCKTMGEMFTP